MILRLPYRTCVGVFGLALVLAGACGGDRATFTAPPEVFAPVEDAGTCAVLCSLDARSVINCTGEVVEACPPELACGAGRCQEPCAAAAADGSSNGCEFYLQPPHLATNSSSPHSCYAAYVVNTSQVAVEVALEFEGTALDVSKSMYRTVAGEATLTPHTGAVMPGEGVVLFVSDQPGPVGDGPFDKARVVCPEGVVPALYRTYSPNGTQFGSSFHLRTNVPVSAAAIYPFGGARSAFPSGTLLFPVASWSKQNVLINPWEAWAYAGTYIKPGVQILAAEDDTDVTIFPKTAIQDGAGVVGSPAGVPATYRLQRGQFLQLVQQEELTGSFVTSTKPTSVVAAHEFANIPIEVGTGDLIGTQIPAYELWGSEYVGVGYRPRDGDEHEPMPYRIVAVRDGTRLDYDPEVPRGAPLELNAGETATFAAGVGEPFVVRSQDAEHPIYVGAYMTGNQGDYWLSGPKYHRMGDREFVNVVAAEQYMNSAAFYADPTYSETSLVIVRAKTNGEFKDVTMECLGGAVTGFRPIGTRGEFEFARVDISIGGKPGAKAADRACYYGANRLRSEGPFTATLWGWDKVASYAFPSGMAARKLTKTPLVITK